MIRTLRTVTFILQSNKRLIPDFDLWYRQWQERFAADPLMVWMKDARNKIEKQGDLEARSFVRAEIIASYLDEGPRVDVPAELFQSPADLVNSIPNEDLREHIEKNGALRIQRRWVENTLPDHELLDATATAYGRMADLVADAHRQAELPAPRTIDTDTGEEYPPGRGGRLPCMVGHGESRTLDFSLRDGSHLRLVVEPLTVDPSKVPELKERYGLRPDDIFSGSGEMENELRTLFGSARVMTEKDGYHITIVFLFRKGKLVSLMPTAPESQSEKYLIMRHIAHEVERLGSDAVILISEAWRAKHDPARPYLRPADAPDREELLGATLVRKEGVPIQLSAKFNRIDGAVKLEETVEERDGAHFMYAPLYEVWDRPVPKEWIEMVSRVPKA